MRDNILEDIAYMTKHAEEIHWHRVGIEMKGDLVTLVFQLVETK